MSDRLGDRPALLDAQRVLTTFGRALRLAALSLTNLQVDRQITLPVATGTAPLVVTSTTKVANLNADKLDDKDTTTAGAASSVVATDASGNVGYSGALVANKNATTYSGYAFVPLAAPLTSTSWDGDAYSSAGKTKIDLSAVFSAPAGIKGVMVFVQLRDSGSSTTNPLLILDPGAGGNTAFIATCAKAENDGWRYANGFVPCDANGDIYYQTVASGASTLDIILQIWGYCI